MGGMPGQGGQMHPGYNPMMYNQFGPLPPPNFNQ
jgi:hypothetical protein